MLKISFQNKLIEAGCDEAGRGCLAGPVVAAAVILPRKISTNALNDSKIISEKQRTYLAEIIKNEALAYAIAEVDNNIIDRINILNASFNAMHMAIDNLKLKPELLMIDGNRFPKYKNVIHKCIVKGDSIYQNIAAASILAKTHRDSLMEKYHEEYPQYQWNKNKGYPTKNHKIGIVKFGLTPLHRKSFSPNLSQYSLFKNEIDQ